MTAMMLSQTLSWRYQGGGWSGRITSSICCFDNPGPPNALTNGVRPND